MFDNIGYMDYHDDNNIKTYNKRYEINKDMTLIFNSSLVYARPTEPEIHFNRLGYDSSMLIYSEIRNTSAYSDLINIYKTRTGDKDSVNDVSVSDFLASHNFTSLHNENVVNGVQMRKNAVNGVYFKDIADEIIYDFVDFNGETIFQLKLKAIDYFQFLYNDYNNQKTYTADFNDNRINLMLDIIELGKAEQLYSGYYKLQSIYPDQPLETITNVKDASGNEVSVNDIDPDIESMTATEALSLLGKPSIKKREVDDENTKVTDHTYQNTIYSYTVSMKNYVGLIVKFKLADGNTNLSEYLTVYDNIGNPVNYSSSINQYNIGYNGNAVYRDENGYFTIEIPLKLTDFNQSYSFVLLDYDKNYKTTFTYGLYNYCAVNWDVSTSNLGNLVKRLYHVGEVAQNWG